MSVSASVELPVSDPNGGANSSTSIPEDDVKVCGPCRMSLLTFTKMMYRTNIFFDIVAWSLLYTVIPNLLVRVFNGSFAKASAFQGLCQLTQRSLTLVGSPLLGNMSDMVGRRPLIIVTATAQAAANFLVAMMPSKWTLLTYYAVGGIMGGIIATLFAAITDLARVSKTNGPLVGQFGRAGVAFSLAFSTGPVVGGFLFRISPSAPVFASGASLLLVVIITLGIRETLAPGQRKTKVDFKDAVPWRRILAAFKEVEVALFALPFVLQVMAETVHSSLVMYLMRRYGWNAVECGAFLSAIGIQVAILQGCLKYVSPRFISDFECVLLGVLAHTGAVLMLGFANKGLEVIPAVFLMALAGLRTPGFLSVMTSHATEDRRGLIQGAVASLRAVAMMVGSPLYALVLAWSAQRSTIQRHGTRILGLMFFVSAGFDALCLLFAVPAWIYVKRRAKAAAADAEADESSSSEPSSASLEEAKDASIQA